MHGHPISRHQGFPYKVSVIQYPFATGSSPTEIFVGIEIFSLKFDSVSLERGSEKFMLRVFAS
ncbi:MAG: hypothetical protein DMG10_03805 [Acidobacteria bacterium]|nr:MAG: hypothetical protein DMG10_03805 [Acidobacteriota bacterium]